MIRLIKFVELGKLRLRQLDGHVRGQGQFCLNLNGFNDAQRHGAGGVGAVSMSQKMLIDK